jgi:prefoldin subunit 5
MDKKAKKRIDLLNKRLQKLRQRACGVRQQLDEPEELERLETEIQAAEAEVAQLKSP